MSQTSRRRWCPRRGRRLWGSSPPPPRGPPRRRPASTRASRASLHHHRAQRLPPERFDRPRGVPLCVDASPGDEDVSSPPDDLPDVALLDTAIDLDVHPLRHPSHEGGEFAKLGEDRHVELLAAEPRVDSHYEEDVEFVQALLRPLREGGLRLDREPHLHVLAQEGAQLRKTRPVEDLRMEGEDVGAGLDESRRVL